MCGPVNTREFKRADYLGQHMLSFSHADHKVILFTQQHCSLPCGFTSVPLSLLWTGSWNIRCIGSHMKRCLWTEKAWQFEGRCHRLCLPPASGKTNLVYFHHTKAQAATLKCFITLPRLDRLNLSLVSCSWSWVCLWINNNHWQEHWM